MNRAQAYARTVMFALVFCAPLLAGCRLPAIDQSGQRIFLPPPNSTSLAVGPPNGCFFPEPAFRSPPAPPECVVPFDPTATVAVPGLQPAPFIQPAPLIQPAPAVQAAPVATPQPAPRTLFQNQASGTLKLTPGRIVAPVGSEVVLTAGVCGDDGYFIRGQSLEWSLSQESVGNFVEVSDGERRLLRRIFHQRSEKLSNNFAIGSTLPRAELITRGTPTPNDDAWVLSGQGWLSLTSATEGTSTVNVHAPEVQDWGRRRQTARVHWVDVQWNFPPSAVISAGQSHVLETVVTRASNSSALAGWIVRYEIVGTDAAAGFEPTGGTVVEQITDAAGRSAVSIMPKTNQFGATQVRVQIIRPAGGSGDPAFAVGEGWTSVTWSAPGLAVNVTGPAEGGMESDLTYRIDVSNPGSMSLRNVVVTDRPSTGLQVVSSQPAGTPFGSRHEWRIAELAPQTSQSILVNCRATMRGVQQFCATATAEGGVQADGCAQTQIFQEAIRLRMSGPQQAEVGDEVTFFIEITNQSDQPLTNLVFTDTFSEGLRQVDGLVSPIEKSIDELPPGEISRISIVFEVLEGGELCHTLNLTADGGHAAQGRSCVTAADNRPAPQPGIQTTITGPPQSHVGEQAPYVISVTNTGNVPLTNVQARFDFSPALAPRTAAERHVWDQGGLLWRDVISTLAVGQTKQIEVTCECLQINPAAQAHSSVSATPNVTDTATTTTSIQAAPHIPRTIPRGEGDPVPGRQPFPASGELKVTVSDLRDPIRLGSESKYLITITNDRNISDQAINVTIKVSEQMEITRVAGIPGKAPVAARSISPDARTAEIARIEELRSGERIDFHVFTRGIALGEAVFEVSVTSTQSALEIRPVPAKTTIIGQ